MRYQCSCATYADGSVHASMCPLHASEDPCWTMARVTGRRRKGTIRRGTCTACGWQDPATVPDMVERWHRTYQRGLITLGELTTELARLDLRYGPQPFRRTA